MIESRLLPLAS